MRGEVRHWPRFLLFADSYAIQASEWEQVLGRARVQDGSRRQRPFQEVFLRYPTDISAVGIVASRKQRVRGGIMQPERKGCDESHSGDQVAAVSLYNWGISGSPFSTSHVWTMALLHALCLLSLATSELYRRDTDTVLSRYPPPLKLSRSRGSSPNLG